MAVVNITILPDVLRPCLKVVFCGTQVGRTSAQRGCYYSGRRNMFWRILFDTGLTPRMLTPIEFPTLPDFGIGLTDLAKSTSGPDASLKRGDTDVEALRSKVRRYQPKVIAFNGKAAAQAFFGTRYVNYGLQAAAIGVTQLWVLPSTSGAARGIWDACIWHALAAALATRQACFDA